MIDANCAQSIMQQVSRLPTLSPERNFVLTRAKVMGLKKDTGISNDQYSELATLFYVTYLAFGGCSLIVKIYV